MVLGAESMCVCVCVWRWLARSAVFFNLQLISLIYSFMNIISHFTELEKQNRNRIGERQAKPSNCNSLRGTWQMKKKNWKRAKNMQIEKYVHDFSFIHNKYIKLKQRIYKYRLKELNWRTRASHCTQRTNYLHFIPAIHIISYIYVYIISFCYFSFITFNATWQLLRPKT